MRKRLFIFAAATCFALSAFATPAFATPAFAGEPGLPDGPTIGSETYVQSEGNSEGNSDGNSEGNAKKDAPPSGSDGGLSNEESYSGEGQTNPSVADPVVAKIGDAEYTTLQAAIDAACTASSKTTITLQSDLTLNNEGLRFDGPEVSTPAEWKDITLDAATHSLTLKGKGIYAAYCKVTIQRCRELTVNAGMNPGKTDANKENATISAVFFCPGTLVLDKCDTVNITNVEPKTSGGSGLCIYNGGDLCIQYNTRFTVSGFMNPGPDGKDGCSGIYIDSDTDEKHNNHYQKIMSRIVVSNNSTLTATNCFHNGITANPVDVEVTHSSEINVNGNGDATDLYAHQGGIGCYYGTMTIRDDSRVISENNMAPFGIFVHNLDVDGTSKIESRYDTIYGIAFNGNAVLQSGAQMTSVGHWGPGIALYDFKDSKGSLTVQKGAVLSSSSAAVGLANGGNNFNVLAGAQVDLNDNVVGLDNYPNATTTVEADAHLEICRNGARGIKNGNNTNNPGPGTLILNAGLITDNNKLDSIPYKGNITFNVNDHDYKHEDYGGGIYNEYGTVSLSPLVKVYNNKAVTAGDDLYNSTVEDNHFNIVKLEPGAKWQVLSDDEKIIDDWYLDYAGEGNRWKPATAKNNTDTVLPQGAALKAAHGINAPTPSPKPVEPTAAPTAAPTTAPTTAPTAAPTTAPTAAPTTAPADNTATAAPATPAPTAQPTVTATPAPTAQASGVIPQTGDSSSPALFSILTLGSITALCVLQKRRKSK